MIALPRQRLLTALGDPWRHRLTSVVAPAGSGKTTLLAQFADTAAVPVAWYTAESSERDPALMLRYLEAALRSALPALDGGWASVEAAAAALDNCDRKAILVLDDLQTLQSSLAEEALERLLKFVPPSLAVISASRSSPGFNLSRLRLDGALREIGAEDLRFRAWEVERLFSEFYEAPLGPEDLAHLARRMHGWAAGLHLFHLATRGRSREERRMKLETLSGSSKLVREYLTDNLLQELPLELKEFLVSTCVLGRLSSTLCDKLLERTNTSMYLRELENRQLFLAGTEDEGYRCHEVLRSHLEALLVQKVGEGEARARYSQAGRLLESSGAHADALYAYCRAEEWEGVGRLLASEGENLARSPAPWIDLLPPAISAQDPWLLLGAARRQRHAGRWKTAMDLYSKAEAAFTHQAGMDACSFERRAIAIWLSRPLQRLSGWDGLIRQATIGVQPRGDTVTDPSDARGLVADGLTALLAGNVREAEQLLESAFQSPDASKTLALGASLAHSVACLLQGHRLDPFDLDRIAEEAEQLGAAWLAWMVRASLALTDREDGIQEAASVRLHFESQNDQWGQALAGLLEGIGNLRRNKVSEGVLEAAAQHFRSLGATTLEAWCVCAHALALSMSEDSCTAEVALSGEALARSARVTGPITFAYAALGTVQDEQAERYTRLAEAIQLESGLRLATPDTPPPWPLRRAAGQPAPVFVRCFGEFEVRILGDRLDLTSIKPRSRQLFRLLALHIPNSVHREVIGDALWPESGGEKVRRNLQVAIHSLRRLIHSVSSPSPGVMLVRNGDSYKLELSPGSIVDVREFEHRLAEGKKARTRSEHQRAIEAFEHVLDLHKGDLLIEDGPAEWVVMERERCRAQAVEAAQALVDIYLEVGDLDSAARFCERGLRLDRYQDSLWRRLLTAHQRAGNRAAENRARRQYSSMLEDLGLAERPAI